ncbi:Ig-like domain-containing protein [Paenibacillus sp. Marseille-Q7038]
MYKISSKSKTIGNILMVFILISGSLFSGPLTANAETTNADIITTKFSGSLETDITGSKNFTFIRPEMPGDVAYDESEQGGNPDDYDDSLLEHTWYFQEGNNSAGCGDGNYTNCGIWFDRQDFSDEGYAFQVTIRDGEPEGESYLRNYFYRTITPSTDGIYSFLVTPPDNNEDLKEALDDTVLYLYKDNFDPDHPLHNLIAGNDDTSYDNNSNLSQISSIHLKTGVTYYMVMTGFWNGAEGNVSFEVTGPGSINDLGAPAVTSVTVTPDTAEVLQGGSKQLTANVEVVDEAAQTVNWSSSDATKVAVDKTGKVTVASNAELGDYKITATSTVDPNKSSTSTIKVTQAPVEPAVTSVEVSPSSANVVQGGSQQLSANVEVVGEAEQTVTWSSNDATGKVTVDNTGKVTVASNAKPGDYTITATSPVDSNKSSTSTITVTQKPAATRVNVTPDSANVVQGRSQQLSASVEVIGGADQTVTWSSNDVTGKVTVDNTGKVKVAPNAKLGDYIITAASTVDNSKTSTSTITVTPKPAVTRVTVTPDSANVVQGESKQLTANVEVVGEEEQTVTWTSSDASKVVVDETGKVTVASDAMIDEYTITATSTKDTSKFASSVITVTSAPAELKYSTGEISDQTATPLTEGYEIGTQETKSITVLNTGTGNLTNMRVELTAGDVNAFELTPVVEVLNKEEESTFTVKVKDDLAAGTYTATISLSADHLSAVTFQVIQVVNSHSIPINPQPPVTPEPTTPEPTTPEPTIPTPIIPVPSVPANPAQPENNTVEVLVNGKVEKAGTLVNSTVNNRTVSTVVVDPVKLNEKLAAEGDHAVVTIPVTTDAGIVIGELNGQMVKNLEQKQAVVKIQTNNATYTLPAQQIDIEAISNQIGQSIALSDIKIQIQISVPESGMEQVAQNAANNGGFSIVIPPLDFSIQGSYGDTKVDITQFNAYVERTVTLPEGIDPNKITTGIVVEPDGSVRHVPTKVVETNGVYSAVINSLTNSTYSVVWHPLEFRDVANHWAKVAINDMGSRMIAWGTGNGLYNPNQEVTRAEFAAIIVRALGLKVEKSSSSFADVSASSWYAGSIQTAYDYKLINGFKDGTFRPADKITREQAMVILSKAMTLTGLKENSSQQDTNEILTSFADASKVSIWAKEHMAAALQGGIINGKNMKMLAPKDDLTRAEIAVLMQRLLRKSGLI